MQKQGTVIRWDTTRAFGEWRAIDRDSRVFLDLTTKVMTDRFEALYAEIGARPGDPDAEQIDIFDREVEIQPTDYFWMIGAAVVRDAVTAFEVYLEEVGTELRHDWKLKPGWSPFFGNMAVYFDSELGLDVDTARVKEIRQLRHILTHQRGKLRTEQLRKQFGTDSLFPGWPSDQARLSPETVTQILDDLDDLVRQVDSVAWTRS